jgi:hypothetical protein
MTVRQFHYRSITLLWLESAIYPGRLVNENYCFGLSVLEMPSMTSSTARTIVPGCWRQTLDQVENYAVKTVAMLYARASQANGPDHSIVDIKARPGLKNGILASLRNGTATITPIE